MSCLYARPLPVHKLPGGRPGAIGHGGVRKRLHSRCSVQEAIRFCPCEFAPSSPEAARFVGSLCFFTSNAVEIGRIVYRSVCTTVCLIPRAHISQRQEVGDGGMVTTLNQTLDCHHDGQQGTRSSPRRYRGQGRACQQCRCKRLLVGNLPNS